MLHALSTPNLTLNLLASPAGRVDGSRLEFAVLTGVLDHSGDPVGTVELREFAVGEGISEIAIRVRLMYRRREENHTQ